MRPDPIPEELESVSMLPSDDSKNGPMPASNDSLPDSTPISPTVPESPTALSQHPKAIASRLYRQTVREGRAGSKTHQSGKRGRSQKPQWSADQIRAKLRTWDRAPFLDLLGAWLECAPTPEALTTFADKFPDRYATSLLAISKIAGFAERKELSASLNAEISLKLEDMSDSQLEDHFRQLAYSLGVPIPKTLDITPTALPSALPSSKENP